MGSTVQEQGSFIPFSPPCPSPPCSLTSPLLPSGEFNLKQVMDSTYFFS